MKNCYVYINRIWCENDQVELALQMVIERIQANPLVRNNNGKVALQRGPIVYCLEEVDNGKSLPRIFLPRDAELTAKFEDDLLEGIVVISGEAERIEEAGWEDKLYRPVEDHTSKVEIKAVPYYAWCNRQPGEMIVWVNEKR